MPPKIMTIQPGIISRSFNRGQPIRQFLVGREELVVVDRSNGRKKIMLADITVETKTNWMIYKEIHLHSPVGNFTLQGISGSDVKELTNAVAEAHRRDQVRKFIINDWDRIMSMHQKWLDLAQYDTLISDEQLKGWTIHAKQLPLPSMLKDEDIFAELDPDKSKIVLDLCELCADPENAAKRHNDGVQERRRREALQRSLVDSWPAVFNAWQSIAQADCYLSDHALQAFLAQLPMLEQPTARDEEVIEVLPAIHREAIQATINGREIVDSRNARFVQKELAAYQLWFDGLEKQPLTNQQCEAVVRDEDNTLVVAGAGTGKTSTIIAKVGYLLHKGLAKPDEILLLAYTIKAAEEMRKRIKNKFKIDIEVRTFHSLGRSIIRAAEGVMPNTCPWIDDKKERRQVINRIKDEILDQSDSQQEFLDFVRLLELPYRSAWEFTSEAEYRNYLFSVEPRCLSGKLVRSYEECEIANWLLLHDIKYIYEHPYEKDTRTPDHPKQYKPDFFLPDHGIYIEHFGVDQNGNTPSFMDGESYRAVMQSKRLLHQQNNTILIETFSWEQHKGILLSNLENKLRQHQIPISQIPFTKALELLNKEGVINPFAELLGTFLSHFKSGCFQIENLQSIAASRPAANRLQLFLKLFDKFLDAYQAKLSNENQIDFDDMITRAIGHISAGRYKSPFRYILVDEFQDISRSRAFLLQTLRKQVAGSKLFCVGDDWQSIFRFTGSDLALMTDFTKHFGYTHRIDLDRTFRFNNRLAEISSAFIQRNPIQLRKTLTTEYSSDEPAVEVVISDKREQELCSLLEELTKKAESVLILYRYHDHLKQRHQKNLMTRFPHLKLHFHTVHSAKGLEADYCILIDLQGGRYGFPTGVSDDPILELVLPKIDQYPHGEERRLFYVALTRARHKIYLLANAKEPSAFTFELLNDSNYDDALKVVRSNHETPIGACPRCTKGHLLLKNGVYGSFFSCSWYPLCEHTESTCPDCKRGYFTKFDDSSARCNVCGLSAPLCQKCNQGALISKKNSSGGEFSGCTRWRSSEKTCL